MHTSPFRIYALLIVYFSCADLHALDAQHVDWTRQFGGRERDRGLGISADPWGNVFVVGYGEGVLPNEGPSYPSTSFVQKFDTWGNALWTRYIHAGPSPMVCSDLEGNAYVASNGNSYLTKFDPNGSTVWQVSPLAPGFSAHGLVAGPSGDLYLAGNRYGTTDVAVVKLDSNGTLLWQQQFGGTREEVPTCVATDSAGNIYVGGFSIDGSGVGGYDTFVAKCDPLGKLLWSHHLGDRGRDIFTGIDVDKGGNVYLAGSTDGALSDAGAVGARDGLLVKYDTSGNLQWITQYGTITHDDALDVAVDRNGGVYVVGETQGHLAGTSAGSLDVVISKFDSDGNSLWHRQMGSSTSDRGRAIDTDWAGNVYFTGWTDGDFVTGARPRAVIVGKIAVPEPTTFLMVGLGVLGAGWWHRRRHR